MTRGDDTNGDEIEVPDDVVCAVIEDIDGNDHQEYAGHTAENEHSQAVGEWINGADSAMSPSHIVVSQLKTLMTLGLRWR